MYGVIVATHGHFASGLKSTIELICGEMENLQTIDYIAEMTVEALEQKYDKAMEKLQVYEHILILTDVFGGTPFNRAAMKYADDSRVSLLSGVNFTLAYGALTADGKNIETEIEEILEEAREGIAEFKVAPARNTEENDEDGI